MRCSLLALSSYLDSELGIEPTGELEAHLLACDRCRTAIGHLREETQRIGGLARVHIPDGAVHELFSQIGLIEEGDELPIAPPHLARPVSTEAPPWFGAERGKALPWAPGGRHDAKEGGEPRELIGGRSPGTAVAEPPELLLWNEPLDQIVTSTVPSSPSPPPLQVLPAPEPVKAVEPTPATSPAVESPVAIPQPPDLRTSAPQPPEIGAAVPQPPKPYVGGAPNAVHKLRDAIAVRIALWRGGGAHLDSSVEIVSGAGAPTWNQRAHPKAWSDSPPVVVAPEPPAVTPPSEHEFTGRRDESVAERPPVVEAPIATPELADVLGEVASLAAPLGRTVTPLPDAAPVEVPKRARHTRPEATPKRVEVPVEDATPVADVVPIPEETSTAREAEAVERPEETLRAVDAPVSPDAFQAYKEPSPPAGPGRHVRRLRSQKPERRSWNPTQPVTGRHVLPIGGPAVAAPDRDRTLWIFAAVTSVVMVIGLIIGRQVTTPAAQAPASVHRPAPTAQAVPPATIAPLPIATPVPSVTVPAAPTPQQLTGVHKLGTGSGGFTVADLRIGEHPNDFRLVFDLAFPDTVTGSPTTVIGYDGPTTIYVEFTGVNGTSPIQSMPPNQIVVSVVPLPMARNTDRLVFKITLRKNAPFDAYYLSGGRLIIDVT
ncbi:MAG: zf-HC2 domain-containing protein [Candidatus Dormiibacterota bacterium]